jgi:hypothetical protein
MTNLTTHSQAGKLFYTLTGFTLETMEGHFYLDGNKVIARKYRGRNMWYLTDLASVVAFKPKTEGQS